MIDLHLRTGNGGAMANACPFLRGEDDEGNRIWLTSGEGFVLDIIDILELEPAEFDDEGEEITPAIIAEGFHANLRCTPEVADLVPDTVIVTPSNPRRVFA